jgi:hypothetical protein
MVEGLEIRPIFSIIKKSRRFKSGNLLGNSSCNELIDAGSLLRAQSLHRLLERARQTQG